MNNRVMTKLSVAAGLVVLALLSLPARAQQPATPEEVTRGFYSWYLHQLSLENAEP